MRRAAFAVVTLFLFQGCVGALTPATVPDALLEPQAGNGWRHDAEASQAKPQSQGLGLASQQTLVYRDDGDAGGFSASLSITTLKTMLKPSTEELRERVRERVRERAGELGIRLDTTEEQGSRNARSGEATSFFVFKGTVESTSEFFTQDATVRILGEVWFCKSADVSVVAAGLAQVNRVTRIGGVATPSEEDDRNWREIVADPQGTVQGVRGERGLVWNVAC